MRMRLNPLGRSSIPSLRPTTGSALTSAVAGDRKRLTRSWIQAAVGTTPDLRRHQEDKPAATLFMPAEITFSQTGLAIAALFYPGGKG